jgi:lysozyme
MGYPNTMLEKLLIKEEGFIPHAYQDHLGFWTIGYGKLIDKRGGGITKEEGIYLLRTEIEQQLDQIRKALPWFDRLDNVRKVILQAMAFQMGLSGLLAFRKTLAAVESGDYALAAKGMRASKWAQQTPGRAERMAKAMETGELT